MNVILDWRVAVLTLNICLIEGWTFGIPVIAKHPRSVQFCEEIQLNCPKPQGCPAGSRTGRLVRNPAGRGPLSVRSLCYYY